ncbi:MAG: hypothetical protein M0P26_02580 [Bacteroidales bacterium]|nr:hypothetical protein [Bacteroidales bacterium]
MPQATLTITYQPPAGATLTDPYWIRIEQVLPAPDRATVGQAATLLDRAFGLQVCEDGGEGEDLVSLNEPALDEEQFRAATAEVIDLSYCEDGWDGSLDMHLKIIRSHPELDYTMRLIGCEQTGPAVPTSGTASLIATTADTLTLEWPVVGDLQCEPAPVDRQGNTLCFAEADKDATLRASWTTVYDLVPIRIPAAAFADDRDLRALAFMRGMVADERLSPEQPAEPDWSLCPRDTWEAIPSNDQVTCYEIVSHRFLCSCSGRPAMRRTVDYRFGVGIVGSESMDFETEEIVPCPGEFRCVNNETECMHLLGSRTVTEYVECAEDNTPANAGGVVWQTSDQNFYLEKCCTWPEVSLPDCPYKTRTWRGGASINNGEQHYRDLYGPATRLVPLSPPGGICGEWTIEQRIMSNNCCDGVPPLEWDQESLADVIAPNSYLVVAVVGTVHPLEWRVSGQGLYLDPALTAKTRVTTTAQVRIYADATACGSGWVQVTDGCSTLVHPLRATVGRWVSLHGGTQLTLAEARALAGFGGALLATPGESYLVGDGPRLVAVTGRFRVTQRYQVGNVGGAYCNSFCTGCAAGDGSPGPGMGVYILAPIAGWPGASYPDGVFLNERARGDGACTGNYIVAVNTSPGCALTTNPNFGCLDPPYHQNTQVIYPYGGEEMTVEEWQC